MWDGQFETLAQSYRAIRYDTRWHGLSRDDGTDYQPHHDLRGLLDHLEEESAMIVGLSLGGRIAIDFALEYPESVDALVLVGPGLSGFQFDDTENNENNGLFIEAWQAGDLERAVEHFMRMWTDGPERSAEEVDPVLREKVREMALANMRLPQENRGRAARLTPPAIERLEEIDAPTLIILGDLDMPDIHTIVDLLASQIEDARLVVVPEAAHLVNMDRPEQFNRAVMEFLDNLSDQDPEGAEE
jgi:pimeloyl-ACP methyl ester carboxylesterase